MILEQANLARDADEVLKDSFHGFDTLLHSHSLWAPFFGSVVWFVVQAEATFVLSLAAFAAHARHAAWLCGAAALALVASRGAVVAVLAASMVAGKMHKRMYRRSMIYWSWWPCWNFVICLVSFPCGAMLGHYLWYSNYQPYYELAGLQPYKDINPAIVPGTQLQDAGVVSFSMGVDIDRSKGGCFKNMGHTYCVAPIVYSGRLYSGLGNAPTFGSYDYFAVGIDCCRCPNQDFRCGDWKNPLASGGLRSLDYKSRPFYRLAVDDWATAYMKEAKHPLFFEWVQSPVWQWDFLWLWATHAAVLSILVPLPIAFLLGTIAAQLLRLLVESGAASPMDTPGPPEGYERAWTICLAEPLKYYLKEREQLMALPVTPAPNYGATPAHRAPALGY